MSEPLQFLIKSAFDATGVTAATNAVKSIDSQINKVSRGFSQFMGLMGAGGIGATLFAFSVKAVKAFADEERAIILRNTALKNIGITNPAIGKSYDDLAESMEKTTRWEKEEILAVQTSLIQRGIWGAELKKALPTVLDLATKTGSLASAADIVGKAFQGNARSLKEVGVIIDTNTPKTQVYAEAMRQLNAMYSGAAQAEMQSTAGKMELITKRFDDLNKRLGELLNGPANGVLRWFEDLATVFEALSQGDSPIDMMQQRIGNLDKQLKDMEAHNKSGTFLSRIFNYAPEEFTRVRKEISDLQAQINSATGGTKPTGSSVATRKPLSADDDAERVKAQKLHDAEAIRNDKEYAKESEKITERIADIEGVFLTDRGRMYARYFGQVNMEARKNAALQGTTSKQLETNNKQMLLKMEADYEAASHTFSGGYKQALAEVGQGMNNWKESWTQIANGAIAPTQTALKEFFDLSSKGALKMGTLLEKTFKSIRDVFYDVVTQMIAKWLVFQALTGILGGGSSIVLGAKKLLGFDTGGPIPGPEGSPMPILAHGGEFMLSANVVKAIKNGQPTSGLGGGTLSSAGAGGHTITNHITLSGSPSDMDIGALCEKISEATRNGLRQAGEMANVVSKTGAKNARFTGL